MTFDIEKYQRQTKGFSLKHQGKAKNVQKTIENATMNFSTIPMECGVGQSLLIIVREGKIFRRRPVH